MRPIAASRDASLSARPADGVPAASTYPIPVVICAAGNEAKLMPKSAGTGASALPPQSLPSIQWSTAATRASSPASGADFSKPHASLKPFPDGPRKRSVVAELSPAQAVGPIFSRTTSKIVLTRRRLCGHSGVQSLRGSSGAFVTSKLPSARKLASSERTAPLVLQLEPGGDSARSYPLLLTMPVEIEVPPVAGANRPAAVSAIGVCAFVYVTP